MQSQENKHTIPSITSSQIAPKSDPNSKLLSLPNEVIIFLLSYLRAYDLTIVQETCHTFNDPTLISSVITYVSKYVYPPSLTDGFDASTASTNERVTYESMRTMEMLVVARVLSRPEPPSYESGYYVSKSWCKTALKWLEAQMEQPPPAHGGKGRKKGHKLSKKQQRLLNRKRSDAAPPCPNVNYDITCEHGDLQHMHSSKTSRARRKVLDKQAWRVLKKLYPDSIQLSSLSTGCLQCALEAETSRKTQQDLIVLEKQERKKVLNNPHVRKFYTRPGKGVPTHCLQEQREQPFASAYSVLHTNHCVTPLIPGIYYTLPREWCHEWRKYVRSGDGMRPHAPDAFNLLCDAHRLPLVPPHLEDYLYGYTTSLLGSEHSGEQHVQQGVEHIHRLHTPDRTTFTEDEAMILSTGIVSPAELDRQRFQLLQLSPNTPPPRPRRQPNLDLDNLVVVEILTEEEFFALEQYWPEIHKSFVLKFAVVDDDVVWSTHPCQDCDAGHPDVNYTVRNRARDRMKSTRK